MKYILLASIVVSFSMAQIQKTMCYIENWESPSTVENTKLYGGECNGKKSINDLKKEGWSIDDIQFSPAKKGTSYIYILQKDTKSKTADIEKVIKKASSYTVHKTLDSNLKKPIYTSISDISGNTAKVNVGNLTIGQSGIIVHKNSDGKSVILASAIVIDTNANSSKVSLKKYDKLKQDAIPTFNIKVSKNDQLILNYLYSSSMVIAPNHESFKKVRNIFKEHNFIHPDLFGAQLKIGENPTPNKEAIQEFCKKQNINTLFVVIKDMVYIIDTTSFKTIASSQINYENEQAQMPFYTRVQEIKRAFYDFSFANKLYNSHYRAILGI